MTTLRSARDRRPLGACGAFALALIVGPLLVAGPAAAFDPGQVAATAGDPAFNATVASQFRLALNNLSACAWPDCAVNASDEIGVTIEGPDRLTGTFVEDYHISVTGVPRFTSNYTTIAVVLKGNTSGVVLQTDARAERTGDLAYTKDVNGSSAMDITLLPANQSGNLTMWVFAYVGDGNRSTHNASEVYRLVSKAIEMRAQRRVPLNVTIVNDENVTVRNVLVSFYARGPRDANYTLIGNTTINSMTAKGSAEANVSWDVTWADPTVYTVKVVVDPLHAHPEVFEGNNVHFFQVNLGAPRSVEAQSQVGLYLVVSMVAAIVGVSVVLWWYNRYYE